jgi:hypothetical protein
MTLHTPKRDRGSSRYCGPIAIIVLRLETKGLAEISAGEDGPQARLTAAGHRLYTNIHDAVQAELDALPDVH